MTRVTFNDELLAQLSEALDWGAFRPVRTVLEGAGPAQRDQWPLARLLLARALFDADEFGAAIDELAPLEAIESLAGLIASWRARIHAADGQRDAAHAALDADGFRELSLDEQFQTRVWACLSLTQWDRLRSLLDMPHASASPAARLSRNLLAIRAHQPDVAERIARRRPWDRVQMVNLGGTWTPHLRTGDEPRAAFDPPTQHAREANALAECEPRLTIMAPAILLGAGTGKIIEELLRIVPKSGKEFAFLVVVTDWESLGGLFMVHDWSAGLALGRVRFLGPDPAELEDFLRADARRIPATGHFALCGAEHTEFVHDYVAAVDGMLLRLARERIERLAPLDAYYRSAAFVDRWRGNEPKRILLQSCRYTTFIHGNVVALADTFRAAGHEVEILDEGDDCLNWIGPAAVEEAVARFRPDIYLRINHLRAETGARLPESLPVGAWIQDECASHFDGRLARHWPDRDFITGYNKLRYVAAGYRVDRFLTAPTPSSANLFGRATTGPRRYEHDIVYVSHHSRPPAAWLDDFRSSGRPLDQIRWVERLYDLLREADSDGELVSNVESRFGPTLANEGFAPPWPGWFVDFHVRLANLFFRQRVLTWIAEDGFELRLFGAGWDAHPTLGQFARGPVPYGAPLRDLYQSAKVVLQLTTTGNLHQRLIEAWLAGALVVMPREPGWHGLVKTDAAAHAALHDVLLREPIATVADLDRTSPPAALTLRRSAEASRPIWEAAGLSKDEPIDNRALLWAETELFRDAAEWFPAARDCLFENRAELRERLAYWLEDDDRREEWIGRLQRAEGLGYFTAERLCHRLLRWVGSIVVGSCEEVR